MLRDPQFNGKTTGRQVKRYKNTKHTVYKDDIWHRVIYCKHNFFFEVQLHSQSPARLTQLPPWD